MPLTPQELLESQVKLLEDNNKLLKESVYYLYHLDDLASGASRQRQEGLNYLHKILSVLNFFYWIFFLGFVLFVVGSLLKLFFPLLFLSLFRF
jgi:hypothetical protein